MINLSPAVRIFVATKPADMRCSFNGLFQLAKNHFEEDPYAGNLYIFRSRRANMIKVLWWDIDGFALFCKKLEVGSFLFPDVRFINGKYEPIEIDRTELMMLLEGIDTGSAKRLKRYRKKTDQRAAATSKVHQIRSAESRNPAAAAQGERRKE